MGVKSILPTENIVGPQDIKDVLERVNGLPTEFGFSEGSKLFVSQEVIDFDTEAVNASQYFDTGWIF